MTLESVSDIARPAALQDLGIVDSEPELALDRLTALAADLLGVPISLVSLVDGDRQFIKSAAGLVAPWAQTPQIPLIHWFCRHAVASKHPLVIEDSRRSALVADDPAIGDLSVIAYAGVPLVLDDGNVVGAFCAVDRRPRTWSDLALRILADLAATVQTLLDLRRSLAQHRLRDPVATGAGRPDAVTHPLDATGGEGRAIVGEKKHAPQSAARLALIGALPGAVARGEITVVFQPIVALATKQLHGFEALARWTHPELGTVGPSEFIPVAEASGEIMLIGEHVLGTACRRLSGWRTQSGEALRVTVNVSPVQLAAANIADVIQGILEEHGLPGSALVLDLSEDVFRTPAGEQRRNLERLRELGIKIALDNFGTGRSAPSDLRRFPVDVIKVDRSLLDGLETDPHDAPLMQAILAISAGMDIELVAEGVETRAQRELLCLSGCHYGQGFLFAPPLPAEEIQVT
jgi:EAL domain-containing protein (putative c-di-GMP-specific phosphodiesterase class I)